MKDWWDSATARERKQYLKSLADQTDDYAKPMLGRPLLGILTKVENGDTSVVTVVCMGKNRKPYVDEIRWTPKKPDAESNGELILRKPPRRRK